MAYYSSPAEMFARRTEKSRQMGNQYWAQAKNGEGSYHYAQAKRCYEQAAANQARADRARATGAAWGRK